MTIELGSRWPSVFAGTTLCVLTVAGCIHESHRVGENPVDAMVVPTSDALADSAAMPDGGSFDATPVVPLGGASTGGWPIAISPEEVARRLSQFLLRKPPSATLTAAVVAAAPRTNEEVGQLTDGLLLEDASLDGRQAFYRWWLRLDAFATATRDATLFPAFTDEVRSALVVQALMFAEDITWRPQGDLATLLTEPAAFVTPATASWFPGITIPSATSATRVMLDPSQYAGIITQPAVVATLDYSTRAEPSGRGMQVWGRYLCQAIPPEPPGKLIAAIPVGMTTRQWLEQSVDSVQSCGACHGLSDPAGFAFGHFDAVGAFRVTEGDLAVDTSGALPANRLWPTDSMTPDLRFTGVVDLAKQLATLSEVARCFAEKWLAFATGKYADVPSDALHVTDGVLIADTGYVIKRATVQGRLHLRGIIRAVTETHTFLDP